MLESTLTQRRIGPVRVVQITDPHLFVDPKGQLLGMDTEHSFTSVLNLVEKEQPDFDLMLMTGDLSQDGSVSAYQRLKELISRFNKPYYWFCGNHDNYANMASVAKESGAMTSIVREGAWQFVLLDSSVDGSVHGYLAEDQLAILISALNERPDLHTLVSFHHHPIAMNSQWIDNIGIKNTDQLMTILESHSNVKAVLWGHVHQEYDVMHKGIRMLATPSSCVQFTPKSENFDVDSQAPGYRWLELNDDGSLNTGVSRVENIEFTIDYTVKGY
jgi:Icc protein